jgi:hypothetical protein
MKIKVVEGGTLVELTGPRNDVYAFLALLNVAKVTVAVNGGKAAALWARS